MFRPRKALVRYLVAVAAVIVATVLRIVLYPVLGDEAPFITLFAAQFLAAWFGGLGPGLLAMGLGAVSSIIFFLPRDGMLPADFASWLGLCLFAGIGVVASLLSQSTHRARRRSAVAAAMLVQEHERFRITLASIGDGVIVTDLNARITFLNGVAREMTGWQGDQAVGQPLETVFNIANEDTRQPVENPALKALATGKVVGLANHTILTSRDGSICGIDDSAAPIFNPRGQMIGAVLVFRDVSQKRLAERMLRRNEGWFRRVADSSPVMIWMTDAAGNRIFYNRPWLMFTGGASDVEAAEG